MHNSQTLGPEGPTLQWSPSNHNNLHMSVLSLLLLSALVTLHLRPVATHPFPSCISMKDSHGAICDLFTVSSLHLKCVPLVCSG